MRKLIVLLATFVAMFVSLGSMPAFADNCTTDSKGVSYCNTQSMSISYGSVSTSTTSVASSDVREMVNLQFENARGFVTSAGCYKASSFTRVPRGAKCWIPTVKGYKFQNSGRGRNGVRYYFEDYIGSKYSPLGTTRFYYDTAHGSWRKQNCGNYVRFSGTAPIPVAIVALVRTFSAVSVTVKATQTATQKVHSTASCSANGSSASADAYGSGTATATATASATATTQTQATATASGQAKTTVSNSAQAAAYVAAQVNMYSGAWVSCSSTTSPPPPSYNAPSVAAQAQACVAPSGINGVVTGTVSNPNNIADNALITIGSQTITVTVPANGSTGFSLSNFAPGTYTGSASLQTAQKSVSFQVTVQQCAPPQQTPPSITSMTTINDVEMGGTSPNFNVGTVVPLGHSGSLICSAQYGSFTPSTVSVSGMSTSTFTYVAPNDPTAPNGLTENVTCTVYDSVTGLSAMRSETFPINPRPAPPAYQYSTR